MVAWIGGEGAKSAEAAWMATKANARTEVRRGAPNTRIALWVSRSCFRLRLFLVEGLSVGRRWQ